MKPSEVNPDEYVAILYAGGHGTMWDFADNEELALIAQKIYEKKWNSKCGLSRSSWIGEH